MPLVLRTILTTACLGLGTLWAIGAEPPAAAPAKPDPYAWKTLFDGTSLKDWKGSFSDSAELEIVDSAMILAQGEGITGIVYGGKVPTTNYEFTFEGQRLAGNDFFTSPTFPVGDSHCTFIAGGWGGTMVGLSSIDFADASENETSTYKTFKNRAWYRYRVRVSDQKIEAWIDDEKLIDMPRKDHKFTTRFEVDSCKPFGMASWCSRGAVRNVRMRELKPEEVKAIPAEKEKKELK